LLHAGFDVHPYEQAATFNELGVGVQLGPRASRILHRLGLSEELARSVVEPSARHWRRWDDGRTLLYTPLSSRVDVAFGFPYYQVHRSDLLYALAGAVPVGRIHLRQRLTNLRDRGDRVEARFSDGTRAEFDVVIGADGIHSTVRRQLFASETRYAWSVAYRGLIPAERLCHLRLDPTAQVWLGPGRHMAHHFVRSGRLVNFVAVVEQDWWPDEPWIARSDLADPRAAFEGWHPQVRAILDAAEESLVWALFDGEPLERWSAGRVILLGDACRPALPFMAQAVAHAIEDGATLAACLAEEASDIPLALRRYEQLRIPRTSRVQAMSPVSTTRIHTRADRDLAPLQIG
jgi:salicylate hydroxylase